MNALTERKYKFMKNERVSINKKKRTKWWITVGVIFTILAGATLGALSMYNWSPSQAIQGLFSTTEEQPIASRDFNGRDMEDSVKEQPAPLENDDTEDPQEETPDPTEDEMDNTPPPTEEPKEETPDTISEPTYVKGVLIANKQLTVRS